MGREKKRKKKKKEKKDRQPSSLIASYFLWLARSLFSLLQMFPCSSSSLAVWLIQWHSTGAMMECRLRPPCVWPLEAHLFLAWLVLGLPTSNPDHSARCKRLLPEAASRLEAGSNKRVGAQNYWSYVSSFSGSILGEYNWSSLFSPFSVLFRVTIDVRIH